MAPPPLPPNGIDDAPEARARPLAAALGLLQPLWWVLLAAVLVLALAGAALRWMLVTEDGSRWLLARLPNVEAEGFSGALLGERWQADRVRILWADGKASLTLEALRADGLRWHWRPNPQAWLGVDVAQLEAARVTLLTGPPSDRTQPVPLDLDWPVHVVVASARAGELQVNALAPMQRLALQQLVLDAQPDASHRVERARIDWLGSTITASGRIGNRDPLPLALDATIVPTQGGDAPPWAAVLRANGAVARFDVEATLRGVPRSGRAAPELDLKAQVQPLQGWPLAALSLQTTALDLSALSSQAPQTRLTGRAEIRSSAQDAPLRVELTLDNALPGRWNEGRLPLAGLTLQASGSLARRDRIEFTRFDAALADAGGSAGRLSGRALWQGTQLTLESRLADVRPQRLDTRAAAMTLSGPLTLTLHGLPPPDFSTPAVALQVDWKFDVEGRLDAAPQPVRLAAEGSANAQQVVLRQLRAQSGAASAALQATLRRANAGAWRVESDGRLEGFDPLPWWPGETGSAWRRGPHRLTAEWKLDVLLPADAARLPPPELAQRLVGNGTLRLHDSVLAGVAVAADVALRYDPAAAPAAGSLQAELNAGGNRVTVDGRGDPAGPGQADHLAVEINAPALAALAPLARLWPGLAEWAPRRGSVSAKFAAEGRWPALRSEGQAQVQQLEAGTLALARAEANWRMDLGGAQPLALLAQATGLQFGALKVDQLRADLRGTLADHRIDVTAQLPVAPPPLAGQVLGLRGADGTQARLQAQGAWTAAAAGGGRWRARVERLRVGAAEAAAAAGAAAPAGTSWADASEIVVDLDFGADGRLLALRADAGRLRLADTVALRWDEVLLDRRAGPTLLTLRADVEDFAVAPLLARLQPSMGWQGDLRLAGRIEVRAAERFDADIVLERRDGDLHLSDATGLQLLGLTELRLALGAHDGLWTFAPRLKGRSVGEIDGQLVVRTTPERRWPAPEATLSGSVQAAVADLGIWSAWVPAGWRLGGELRGTATLGGTFGDPRFTGSVAGSGLAVRNLLQGVNVRDGVVALRLEGDTATIDTFTLRGGDGTLALSGGATLGRSPQARVRLVAERFRVLGRVDRMVVASGEAELTLQAEQLRLEGRFGVDEGLFDISRADAPSLDSDVTIRHAGDPEPAAPEPAAAKPARNVVMAVDIDLGRQLRLRGRGLDTLLRGQLRLGAPGGRLAVTGTISADEGTYAAYGQKLEIERGIVAFSGAANNPRLDVLAIRPNLDMRVGVAITGNLDSPRVRLYADPEMSDNEKLSWLVLGRAPDGLGRTDTALLQRAAVALLAGEGEAPTDELLRNLGIDDISLKQSDTDVRDTVISLGKQLSRRWYVGYERGVNATTGTWQLIYRIAQRFTLRAQSGADNSLDVIWTWRFQETPADAGMRKSIVLPP